MWRTLFHTLSGGGVRSAHSVSLQIYVFPFTCFAFSLFFCHFVSPSPSLLPSFPLIAQPHRVVRPVVDERRSALRFGRRQAPCASLDVPAHRGGLHLIDADLYDGTASWGGEVLFRFASLSSFPLILFCLALCAVIECNCTRGVLALC